MTKFGNVQLWWNCTLRSVLFIPMLHIITIIPMQISGANCLIVQLRDSASLCYCNYLCLFCLFVSAYHHQLGDENFM